MPRTALFPGSFDPFTNGHLDIVRRGLGLFDHVIIAIGTNSSKQRYLPVEQMQGLIAGLFEMSPGYRYALSKALRLSLPVKPARLSCCAACATAPILSTKSPSPTATSTSTPGWKRCSS